VEGRRLFGGLLERRTSFCWPKRKASRQRKAAAPHLLCRLPAVVAVVEAVIIRAATVPVGIAAEAIETTQAQTQTDTSAEAAVVQAKGETAPGEVTVEASAPKTTSGEAAIETSVAETTAANSTTKAAAVEATAEMSPTKVGSAATNMAATSPVPECRCAGGRHCHAEGEGQSRQGVVKATFLCAAGPVICPLPREADIGRILGICRS
jgi:cytoskeletal protein RodZ